MRRRLRLSRREVADGGTSATGTGTGCGGGGPKRLYADDECGTVSASTVGSLLTGVGTRTGGGGTFSFPLRETSFMCTITGVFFWPDSFFDVYISAGSVRGVVGLLTCTGLDAQERCLMQRDVAECGATKQKGVFCR